MGESDRKEALTVIREKGGSGEFPRRPDLWAGPQNRSDDARSDAPQAAAGGDPIDRSWPPPSHQCNALRRYVDFSEAVS